MFGGIAKADKAGANAKQPRSVLSSRPFRPTTAHFDRAKAEDAVALLRRQHEHIDELLCDLNVGRWWPDDHAGNEDAASVLVHARTIEESMREISKVIATMKA